MKKHERMVWTRIIDLYKSHSHLWDKKDSNYANRIMREDSFSELLDIYKELDDTATVECLKSKIMNLRSSFFRELKKINATSRESGFQYKPTLWYYEHMLFLRDCHEPSRGRSSSDVKDALYLQEFLHSESEQSEDDFVPKKKQRQTVKIDQDNAINSANKSLNQNEDDKRELFSKCFAIQLQEVDDEQLTIVNKLISDVIFYGKTGQLTIKSSINLG